MIPALHEMIDPAKAEPENLARLADPLEKRGGKRAKSAKELVGTVEEET